MVHYSPYELVRDVCNFLIPVQLILWLQEPLLRDPNRPLIANIRASLPFMLRSGLIIAAVVAAAEWGKHIDIWPQYPGFPSGHSTTCAAFAVCLIAHRGSRWAILLGPMAAVMPVALVLLRAHVVADVIGGFLFGTLATATLWRLTERPRVSPPTDTDTPELV